MKSIRSARSSRWVWLTAMGLVFVVACGGAQEVPRPAGPVKKVAWDDSDAERAPEDDAPASDNEEAVEKKAVAASEDEEVTIGGNVIDLDALPAKAAPKPAPSPAPEPAPPPVAAAAAEEAEEEEEEAEPPARAEPEPEPPSSDPLAAELRKRRAQAKARAEAKREKAPPKKKKRKAKRGPNADAVVASYKGSDPCRATKFSVPRVREACASAGRAGAKRVMKDAIGKATATGQLLKCSNCHSNQNDYALKDDAVAELKRWLESSSS